MASWYFSHVENFLIDWLIEDNIATVYRLLHYCSSKAGLKRSVAFRETVLPETKSKPWLIDIVCFQEKWTVEKRGQRKDIAVVNQP